MEAKKSFWKKEWKSILFFAVFLIAECCLIYNCYYNPKFEEIQKAKFENTKDKYEAENYLVTRCLSVLGGTIALFAFYLNWKRTNATEETNRIAEKNNDNNYWLSQFAKASELLKDEDSLAARLSGIYLFEKIMNSNEEYHWAVIEILSAYVREKRHISKYLESTEFHRHSDEHRVYNPQYINVFQYDEETDEDGPNIPGINQTLYRKDPVEADIQAIINVLGNRKRTLEKISNIDGLVNHKTNNDNLESIVKAIVKAEKENKYNEGLKCSELLFKIKKIDLSNTFLYKADFSNLKMDNIDFSNSFLTDSLLKSSSFIGANFDDSHLNKTDSSGIYYKITGSHFHFANCLDTNFHNSKIELSSFWGAILANSKMISMRIIKSNLKHCDVSLTDYSNSSFDEVDFMNARNQFSDNSPVNAYFTKCTFSEQISENYQEINHCEDFIKNNKFQ